MGTNVVEVAGTFQKTVTLIEMYIFQIVISMENITSFFTSGKYKELLRGLYLRGSTH
jgi:hypothetical protein